LIGHSLKLAVENLFARMGIGQMADWRIDPIPADISNPPSGQSAIRPIRHRSRREAKPPAGFF